MSWVYKSQLLGENNCHIKDVRVGMHIIVQYPVWNKDQYTGAAIAGRWNSMIKNLIVHEQGHITRNVQIANELVAALNAMPSVPCEQFIQRAEAIIAQYVRALEASNSSYDHATNHGQTQGAIF